MVNPDVLDIKFSEMLSKVRLLSHDSSLSTVNIAFLRNMTIEPIMPFFQYQCFRYAVKANIYTCDYDNIMQDVLNPQSGLYEHNPKIIFIFIKLEQIAPKFYLNCSAPTMDHTLNSINEVISYYKFMLDAIRMNTDALVVLNSFEIPTFPFKGILDSQKNEGEVNSVRKLNSKLVSLLKENQGALLIDFDLICSRIGSANYYDNMQWHMSKMPFSNLAMRNIAAESSKYVIASEGQTKKCIILDCDNTLWGGVVGEDGENGILIDQNHPGSYFLQFQKDLLTLKSQGVLLAICSKNNEIDVLSALRNNDNIVLKEHDFSCMKINWELKTDNIKNIARELNIGSQHIVFVDDSEFEIEMVRKLLPEVSSILIPKNLSKLKNIFDGKGYFDKLQESEIDFQRTQMYRSENSRKKELNSSSNIEDYYSSLGIIAKVSTIDDKDVARVAQLTQKTNQFNLTTRRYTEKEITTLQQSDDSDIVTLKAEDKFGAYGLIGVAILKYREGSFEIDTFLMSCRAIGRKLEEILFNECINQGKLNFAKVCDASFIKTEKNMQVEYFLEEHGFEVQQGDLSKKIYRCELGKIHSVVPSHIQCLYP